MGALEWMPMLRYLLHVDVPGLVAVVCALLLTGGAYLSHSVHARIVSIERASRTRRCRSSSLTGSRCVMWCCRRRYA
jgi:ABC-type amino acid transport system permease subunit